MRVVKEKKGEAMKMGQWSVGPMGV